MRVVVMIALVSALAGAQESETRKRAKQLFDEGMKQYDAGRYKEAIESYHAAYERVPVPLLLFDLGQAYRLAGMPQKAIEYYERYLDLEPNGRAASEAQERLATLQEELREAEQRAAEAKRLQAEKEAREKAEREAEARAAAQSAPAVVAAPAQGSAPKKSHKWVWGVVGGVAVVVVGVGLGVGLGIGLSKTEFPAANGTITTGLH